MEEIDLANLAYYPLEHEDIEHFAELQDATFWTAGDITFGDDRNDWDNLDQDTKSFVENILFLFAPLDGIVNKNLIENFQKETSFCKEVGFFYVSQAHIEQIHNKVYSLLIRTLIDDPKRVAIGLNSTKHFPEIKRIAEWALSMMDTSIPLLERIIAFCCIEGVIFSSAFAGIYFVKRRNILPALTKANEWIARDEALHTRFGVHIYHVFTQRLNKFPLVSETRVHEIVRSAVTVNELFTRNALKTDLVGLNANDMMSYVYNTADKLCESLGYSNIYNIPNRLDWMLIISLPNKTNFFESKVSEYARQQVVEDELDMDCPC